MNELLKRIFTEIISKEDDCIKTDKYIDTKIQEIVENYQERLNADELEELRGYLYQVALISEKEAFVLGVKYLLKMEIALLSDL